MRIANRLLAAVLAVVLGGAAVVLIIEVIAHATGSGPVVAPWNRVGQWADTTPWQATALLVGGIVAAIAGLVLLFAELRPARAGRLPATSGVDGVNTGYTRRGVIGAVSSAANSVDGVASTSVTLGRRSVRVAATSVAGTLEAANALSEPVTAAVTTQLQRLRLADPPRVSVTTRTART